jgi:hypothetical protein
MRSFSFIRKEMSLNKSKLPNETEISCTETIQKNINRKYMKSTGACEEEIR